MATKIYDLFQSRYRMFKQVYLNRISVGIELMIKDVFLQANPYYNFPGFSILNKIWFQMQINI